MKGNIAKSIDTRAHTYLTVDGRRDMLTLRRIVCSVLERIVTHKSESILGAKMKRAPEGAHFFELSSFTSTRLRS